MPLLLTHSLPLTRRRKIEKLQSKLVKAQQKMLSAPRKERKALKAEVDALDQKVQQAVEEFKREEGVPAAPPAAEA